MTPIDIQVSRSKVKVTGHAYSLYVGEGGHWCFTNIYISLSVALWLTRQLGLYDGPCLIPSEATGS